MSLLLSGDRINLGPWSIIGARSERSTGGLTPPQTLPLNTTGAHLIVGFAATWGNAGANTFADSRGNTWEGHIAEDSWGGGDWLQLHSAYILNGDVGYNHTFSFNGFEAAIAIIAVEGARAVNPRDVITAVPSTITPLTLNLAQPSADDALIIIAIATYIGLVGTPSGGFKITSRVGYVSGQGMGLTTGYLAQSVAGPFSSTVTIALPNQNSSMMMAFLPEP